MSAAKQNAPGCESGSPRRNCAKWSVNIHWMKHQKKSIPHNDSEVSCFIEVLK